MWALCAIARVTDLSTLVLQRLTLRDHAFVAHRPNGNGGMPAP